MNLFRERVSILAFFLIATIGGDRRQA